MAYLMSLIVTGLALTLILSAVMYLFSPDKALAAFKCLAIPLIALLCISLLLKYWLGSMAGFGFVVLLIIASFIAYRLLRYRHPDRPRQIKTGGAERKPRTPINNDSEDDV
jgi:hypothetical protein